MKKIAYETLQEYLNEAEGVFKGQIDTGLEAKDVDQKEFLVGLAVEKIHSDNLAVQKELVLQNLAENPKFYSEAMKKGLVANPAAINTYKKYFIDKDEPEEENNV